MSDYLQDYEPKATDLMPGLHYLRRAIPNLIGPHYIPAFGPVDLNPTVNRVLGELQKRGLIEFTYDDTPKPDHVPFPYLSPEMRFTMNAAKPYLGSVPRNFFASGLSFRMFLDAFSKLTPENGEITTSAVFTPAASAFAFLFMIQQALSTKKMKGLSAIGNFFVGGGSGFIFYDSLITLMNTPDNLLTPGMYALEFIPPAIVFMTAARNIYGLAVRTDKGIRSII